jgi:hypothetical protein
MLELELEGFFSTPSRPKPKNRRDAAELFAFPVKGNRSWKSGEER